MIRFVCVCVLKHNSHAIFPYIQLVRPSVRRTVSITKVPQAVTTLKVGAEGEGTHNHSWCQLIGNDTNKTWTTATMDFFIHFIMDLERVLKVCLVDFYGNTNKQQQQQNSL